MYQAIIVDDEEKVCKLIIHLGDFEQLGIEVITCCYDGQSALEAILRHKPDIVITDIRMPSLDGLELTKRIKEAGLPTQIIIISGYRHFEYAHQAMQYNIVDYLLKPIDKRELRATLERVIERIEKEKMNRDQHEHYEKLLEEHSVAEKDRLLSDLLKNQPLDETLESFNDLANTDFVPGLFQVALLYTSPNLLANPIVTSIEQLEESLRSIFEDWARLAFLTIDNRVCLIINYEAHHHDRLLPAISMMLGKIGSMRDIYGNFNYAIGLGRTVTDLFQLADSYKEAQLYEQARLVFGWNKAIDSLPPEMSQSDSNLISQEEWRRLDVSLEVLQAEAVAEWFDHWKNSLHNSLPSIPALLEAKTGLLERLDALSPDLAAQTDSKLDGAGDIYTFCQLFKQGFVEAVEMTLAEREQEDERPIRLAKQFIQDHYMETITLADVAEHVAYTPSYLSTLFKQSVGMSFSDYLLDLRIQKAKELLKETDQTIYEISAAVGYPNAKYFRKLFKTATGVRPSEYRALYW